MRHIVLFSCLAAGLLLCGCDPGPNTAFSPVGPDEWLPLRIGDVDLTAQIVLTESEQRKGLMYRDSLPENSGMLFPYASPRRLSFWMANTRIPLDIGYFDGTGLLLEVHRMVPFDTTPTPSRGTDMQFALEMNAGWFAGNGLYPGERMDMGLLVDALRRRGADPRVYGLGD